MKRALCILAILLLLYACSSNQSDKNSKGVLKEDAIAIEASFEAVKFGDMAQLKKLLQDGVDINCKWEYGESLLHKAVDYKDLEMVNYLIESGANINAKDNFGRTPLYCADPITILGPAKDMAKLLLEKGADINVRDKNGATPLHYVKHEELAQLYVSKGADVNAITNNGHTPLDYALDMSYHKKAAFLLKRGGVEGDPYRAIMMEAAEKGNIEKIKEAIVNGANPNTANVMGETPLHRAAAYGHKDIVEFLLRHGAEVDCKNNLYKRTPLCLTSKWQIAEILIANGADVNSQSYYDNKTPLHEAAGKGAAEVVQFLIAKEALIEAKSHKGRTPLHIAAKCNQKKTVLILLKAGADINSIDENGFTALHFAADSGYKVIVELFIVKGADVNTRNIVGKTPLDSVIDDFKKIITHFKEMAELLRAYGAKTGKELQEEGK